MTLALPLTVDRSDAQPGWPDPPPHRPVGAGSVGAGSVGAGSVGAGSVVAQLAAAVHSASYRVEAEPSGAAELLRRLRGPLIEALDELISTVPAAPASAADLTAREVEVLALLARGLTAHACARLLGISPRTVRKHLEHVYRKLDCSDRLVAVDVARRLGIIG